MKLKKDLFKKHALERLEGRRDEIVKRLLSEAWWIILMSFFYLIKSIYFLVRNFDKEKLMIDNLSFSKEEWIFALIFSVMFVIISFLFVNDYCDFFRCSRRLNKYKKS